MKHPYKRLNVNGKTMLEHRHLMEQQLERPLTKAEWVHHKDENTTNNNLENLQLTNIKEHASIHHKNIYHKKEIKYVELTCPICKKAFKRHERKYLWNIKKGIKNFYCSIECKNKMQKGKWQERKINIENFNKVKEGLEKHLTGYQISKKYNLSSCTVYNHLKKMDYQKIRSPKLQDGLFRCSYCKKFLPKTEFSKNKKNNHGIRCRCKICTKLTR